MARGRVGAPVRRLAAVALLLAALPLAVAQGPSAGASPVSFLVYHAAGGPDPDPFASALAPPPSGAQRLPATFLDRAEMASRSPENTPESAPAHYREIERRVSAREAAGASLAIRLSGELRPGALRVTTQTPPTNLTLVLFEHGALHAGLPHAYVARLATDELAVAGEHTQELRLDPRWDALRLGVVALAREGGAIAQSASWLVSADRPTVQVAKSVLVEHVTATWCGPCGPADEAIALLALQRGVGGPLDAGDVSYLREPGVRLYAGLALGGAAAFVLARRRPA